MKALRRLRPTPTTEAVESGRFDLGFLFNEVGEMPHQNPAVLTARLGPVRSGGPGL
jgi:hypothetical protein